MDHDDAGVPRLLRRMTWVLTIIIGVSVVGGLGAAAFGGRLTDLGDGAGGLFGLPSLLLTAVALFVGIPAAVIVAGRLRPSDGWLGSALLVAGGAGIIAVGYLVIAHMVDPCANGWWDTRSRIGSQPLCERFGSELNWHTRFHLLAHAAPAAALLTIYAWAIKRSSTRHRPTHEDHDASPEIAT